jgi:ATPase subunit of ABC transporter with duplicated ATPase domains
VNVHVPLPHHTSFAILQKTTLVKLIMGKLEPSEGEIKRNPHARFALVNQHHADQIDLTLSPLQFLQKLYPGDSSNDHNQVLRGHLSSCGVTSGSTVANAGGTKVFDLQNTPCAALSGGQRSRVALSAVSFARPHVLVLDEPTVRIVTTNGDRDAVFKKSSHIALFPICLSPLLTPFLYVYCYTE